MNHKDRKILVYGITLFVSLAVIVGIIFISIHKPGEIRDPQDEVFHLGEYTNKPIGV
jgi:hypothetical protein